jgi:hypothetical protein
MEGYHDMSRRLSIRAFLFRLRSPRSPNSLDNKSNGIEGRKDDNIIHRLQICIRFSYDDGPNVKKSSL